MTPESFVWKLHATVVEDNHAIYRALLLNTDPKDAFDPYWKRVLTIFSDLSAEQREVLIELTRQVAIDTTANVLGVIDGTRALEDVDGEFRLTYGARNLAGDLQSLFLERAEQLAP
ncbi:hypothetical protein [Dyella jiangningensis]|jgi:phosphopantetheine adenylyltransferase|uniref:Uncharacterized protein n=1 Tax=Dyella jiangningensis TaxID=1379159 RepID=A0A023NV74_9GAMM|nr:hypothetical protein [Dyella jiangningensis]AHX14776.1 hypothetical protein CH75_17405 [Dyella jiangningensis]MDG2537800.1 hypothetical protein [Dyella jiangningensis]RAO75905.1 hypothetical protein CA260_17925 [Dyella jiangningensis]